MTVTPGTLSVASEVLPVASKGAEREFQDRVLRRAKAHQIHWLSSEDSAAMVAGPVLVSWPATRVAHFYIMPGWKPHRRAASR